MSFTIAVSGANSQSGKAVLELIEERNIPASKVIALAVNAQPGQEVSYGEDGVADLKDITGFDFAGVDFLINAGGTDMAKSFIPKARKAGTKCIDISSAFRMDMDVPLVVGDVNPETIKDSGLVAGPNCMVTGIAAALKPLHDLGKLSRVHIATYQSVSGVGKAAMDELFNQTRSIFMADPQKGTEFPKQIAFNVIPQIGKFLDDRTTEEELSVKAETKKILDTKLKVTATCVRVPVFVGHAAAVHIELEKEVSAIDALAKLRETRGVTVIDLENDELEYMTPEEVQGENDVYVSRVREDSAADNGLALWVVLDNVHRGLALNAVQILEAMV